MKVKVVYGKSVKMYNRRVGLAYLSDGSWFIKGKSLCVNLGTGHKYIDTNVLRLSPEAMRGLMTMFMDIISEHDLHYTKEK